MLEGVHARGVQGCLVHERDVPEDEVESPEGQRNGGMGQEAKLVDEPEPEQRLQHRTGQADDETERRQIADQNVLEHVHEQELGREGVDRRDQREQDERKAEPEDQTPPGGHRRAAAVQRPRALPVEERQERRGHELPGLERPARQQRRPVRADPHVVQQHEGLA